MADFSFLATPRGVHVTTLAVATLYVLASWIISIRTTGRVRPSVGFMLKAVSGGLSTGAGIIMIAAIVDPALLVSLGNIGGYLISAALFAILLPLREIGLDPPAEVPSGGPGKPATQPRRPGHR